MLLTLKDIYDDETAKSSVGGTYDDIDGIVVDPGHLLTIRYAVVQDLNNDVTKIEMGIVQGSTFHKFNYKAAPGAGVPFTDSSYFLVPAGHRFRARLTGCTAGDYLRMHLQGYIYLLGEG
jgi:hypothetical protein